MEILTIKEIIAAVDGKLLCGNENHIVNNIVTNSKEISKGNLFIPIKGKRFDAHDFIKSAFDNGACATFTQKENFDKSLGIFIKVKDTKIAFQKLASYYRNKFNIPIIGVTGSVGKTSTKEMISAALLKYGNVMKTKGNLNSQLGVPMTMFQLNNNHDIAIVEMGISEPGEMKKLANIVKPSSAVITNIGISHIENLKTRENILKEKLYIASYINTNIGKLYLNGSNDIIRNESGKFFDFLESLEQNQKFRNGSVIYYGIDEFCDYKASDIKTIGNMTEFILDCKFYKGKIIIPCIGAHNVYNALAGIAIAYNLGLNINDIQEGLLTYKPIAMRQQIHRLPNINLIDDSYNASPDSMKSGIDILLKIKNNNRGIAVLADMLELGEKSKKSHFDLGTYLAKKNIEVVVTVGDEAKEIINGIRSKSNNTLTASFQNNDDAFEYLKTIIKTSDNILVKGSRGMRTDKIVDKILHEYSKHDCRNTNYTMQN